jgi:hypothetical protein
MKEIWKDIPEYEGFYQASNLGNIRSLDRIIDDKKSKRTYKGRILRQIEHSGGYKTVTLSKDGKAIPNYVHRLVMLAFKGFQKLDVDHLNMNKKDNRLINLEYVSRLENIKRFVKSDGMIKKYKGTSSKYVGVHWSKQDKKWCSQRTINHKTYHIGYFKTELEASQAYNNFQPS